MSSKSNVSLCALLCAGAVLIAPAAQAQVNTVSGRIAHVSNGWGQEGYYIGLHNPSGSSGCSHSSDYIALSSRSDLKYIVANVMLAFSTGAVVHVAFEGCSPNGVGVIVGLRVLSN